MQKDQPLQGLKKWEEQNKMHSIDQETDKYQKEDNITTVNITSIKFNGKLQ